jgi:Fur family peroxide stress response transcriptional regulator
MITILKTIEKHLTDSGIKPSYQRIRIFSYLIEKKNHPTVEMIHKELIYDIPTLSKTTVYNTLKQFVEKGITQIINIEDNETRYDADISTHGHFKCIKCNKVYDFRFDNNNLEINDLEDFEFLQTHLYIKGICKKCKYLLNTKN